MLDQATRGEKKLKEEEQRIKKVALNISKDVKKFWLKIEKLVLYKDQMELDEKKKKALDKQLKFLLGQTERYSTMLAENLGDSYKPVQQYPTQDQPSIQCKERDKNDTNKSTEMNAESQGEKADIDFASDDDYDVQSDDRTLKNAISLYPIRLRKASQTLSVVVVVWEVMAILSISESHLSEIEINEEENHLEAPVQLAKGQMQYDFNDEHEDGDFILAAGKEQNDEATLSEEEELAKADASDRIFAWMRLLYCRRRVKFL